MKPLDELEEIKELVNNDKHFKYKNIVIFNCDSIKKSLKALEIIKPYLKLVGNCLQVRVPLVDEDNLWAYVKEITNEEELDTLKEVLK